jgi:hypothetical protein
LNILPYGARAYVNWVTKKLEMRYRELAVTGSSTLASRKNFAASSGGVGLM